MADPKKALDALKKEYGYSSNKKDENREETKTVPQATKPAATTNESSTTKRDPKAALEALKKKYPTSASASNRNTAPTAQAQNSNGYVSVADFKRQDNAQNSNRYATTSREGISAILAAVEKNGTAEDKKTATSLHHYYVEGGPNDLAFQGLDAETEAERLRKKYSVEMPEDNRVKPNAPSKVEAAKTGSYYNEQLDASFKALEPASTQLKNLVSRLETTTAELLELQKQYEANPTPEIAARYEQKYAEYTSVFNEYNTAYKAYDGLYTDYESDLDAFNKYFTADNVDALLETAMADRDANSIKSDAGWKQATVDAWENRYGPDAFAYQDVVDRYADNYQAYVDREYALRQDRKTVDYINYMNLANEADFEKYASQDTWLADYAEELDQAAGDNAKSKYDEANMSEEEIAVYNYLYNKNGSEAADEYYDFLKGYALRGRHGHEKAEKIQERGWLGETVGSIGTSALAGVQDFFTNAGAFIAGKESTPTATQMAASEIVQEAGKGGQWVYGGARTVGNMMPSIAASYLTGGVASGLGASAKVASTAGKIVGAATMGTSAAGGAYNQALSEGWRKEDARAYGALVGLSEGSIQYLLGGIGAMGGISDDAMMAAVSKIDNTFARIAASGAIKVSSEVLEEEIQLFLEPKIASMIGEVAYKAPTGQDILDTAMMTVLSTAVLSAGDVAGIEINYKKYGDMILKQHTVAELFEVAKRMDPDSQSYKLVNRLSPESAKASDIGRLYAQMHADGWTDPNLEGLKKVGADMAVGGEEAVDGLIESGLESKPLTESRQIATKLQEKRNRGETISELELAELAVANEKAIHEETNAEMLDTIRKATGYGDAGAREFAAERERRNYQTGPQDLMTEFDPFYQAGRTNMPKSMVNIQNTFQQAAYTAGLNDYVAGMNKTKAEAADSVILDEASSGFDFTNAPKDVKQAERNFTNAFFKAMGVRGGFDGKGGNADYNAFYNRKTGGVAFAEDFGIDPELMRKLGSEDYLKKVEKLAAQRGESFLFYVAHEVATHTAMKRAPETMKAFVSAMYNHLQKENPLGGNLARDKQTFYASHNKSLDTDLAIEEVVADHILDLYKDEQSFMAAMERIMNGTDEQAKQGAVEYAKGLQGFIERLKAWWSKLTGKENAQLREKVGETISELERLRDMFEAAISESMANVKQARAEGKAVSADQVQKNTIDDGVQYDLKGKAFAEDKYFARQIDKWDELKAGARIKVGVVQKGSALNRVGLPASGMYFDVGKIKKSMVDHNDHLTSAILKGIPDLLNNPIVIVEYKGPNGDIQNTVNVYGNLFVNNIPVVVGIVMNLDRSGNNVINNIRTVHARSNFAKQITDESVLYLNENKKKTRKWFQVCGNLNVPLEGTQFGVIRSISFEEDSVKTEVRNSLKDSDYLAAVERGDMATAQKMVDEAAKAAMPNTKVVDENGAPLIVYHQSKTAFNEFRKGTNDGLSGRGIYFSYQKGGLGKGGVVRPFYVNVENPITLSVLRDRAEELQDPIIMGKWVRYEGQIKQTALYEHDEFDGVMIRRDEVVVKDPAQIKSADPVTYDDDGNVIPLSKRFNAEKDDIRYSIKGEKAVLSEEDKANLQTAKQMKESGKSNEEIYKATGWYTQSDGKWRSEIPDEIMVRENFNRTGLQSAKDAEADKYLAKAENSLKSGAIDEETYDELVEFAESIRTKDLTSGPLSSFLNAPNLYAAYPQLKNVKLFFKKLHGMQGYTDAEKNQIVLDPDGLHDANQTVREGLAHEIQHIIQNIEGFTRGSSPAQAGGYEAYRRTGGEIEARDVEDRLRMTPEERKDYMPVRFSLKSDSTGKTLTKEQVEYFKDSKARDENGNLMVVYHGSRTGGFTVFNRNHNYYTDDRTTADSYAPNGAVYAGYVNITKPFVVDAGGEKWSGIPVSTELKKMLTAAGGATFKERGKWRTSVADIVSLVEDMVDEGVADYDGVIVRNVDDTGSYFNGDGKNVGTDYITFRSEQFKNVDNLKPSDVPDIRYSLKSDSTGKTLSKGQQEYFKDSKVRDEQGRLSVVYHSTPNAFTVFDNDRLTTNTNYDNAGFGHFVTANRAFSERFGDIRETGVSGRTMELYANATKPITHPINAHLKYKGAELDGIVEQWFKVTDPSGSGIRYLRDLAEDGEISLYDAFMEVVASDYEPDVEAEKAALVKAKYDAVEIVEGLEKDLVEGSTSRDVVTSWAIFDSKQMKDVDNLNPTEDEDILFSLKGEQAMQKEIQRIRSEGRKAGKSDKEIEREVIQLAGPEYGKLLKKFGAIKPGEKAYRRMAVPEKSEEDRKVSQTVRTILEAKVTPNAAVPLLQEMVVSGDFSYDVYTDEAAIHYAETVIQDNGYENTITEWAKDVGAGKVNKSNTALGWAIYNAAASKGDLPTAMNVLNHMVQHQRSAAQAVQATRILKKLTPDAQLYGVVQSVQKLEEDLNKGTKFDGETSGRAAYTVGKAKQDAAKEVSKGYTSAKVKRDGKRIVVEIDSNQAGEPFVFEYAQKVGEALANTLEAKRNQTEQQRTFLQHIKAELARFASEKMPKQQKGKPLTAIDILRDYVQNQAFFSEAWEAAQVEIRDRYADDEMFAEFINSGIGVDAKHDIRNAIFTRALVKAAAESKEGKSVLQKQAALGFTGMADTIAEKLIEMTGAEGEMADTIRDAAYAYVQETTKDVSEDSVDGLIKSAMTDIGVKLSETVLNGTGESAKQAIVAKLVGKYGFGMAEATATAEIVAEHFDRMSRSFAENRLKSMFKERKISQKSIPEKLEQLSRLGAFDADSAFNQKAAERIFRGVNLTVNEELARQFMEARTQEERDDILALIYQDIGRQMPSTFMDKWNAWRYLSMLGNPRTHVRNILGNFGFAPVVAVKDLTATGIEAAVSFVSGGKIQRTKAMPSRDLLQAAWADYANVAEQISAGGKYNDKTIMNSNIEKGRRVFGNTEQARTKVGKAVAATVGRAAEVARRGNSNLLETEDVWFSKPHYAFALAQYCKANGITADQLRRGKALGAAREYAIKEAQKATYRDTNVFSEAISSLGRYHGSDNAARKVIGVLTEGVLPFRKTPANILVRGVEYSPIGLLKALFYDLVQVRKGNKTAAEAIDHISAGLTGTGLAALGFLLASLSLVRGAGGDDKEEKEFAKLQGHQAYALELPDGTSVTLDWLAPEALPFFIGVNLCEMKKESKEDVKMTDILSAVSNVTEPLLEMSCLQSLNNAIDSVGYASSNELPVLATVATGLLNSYLTQAFPTIAGQIERSAQDVRMTTYTEKDAFLTSDAQYTLGKVSAKVPGWDYNQIPYIDAWGRKDDAGSLAGRIANNFLNPAYVSKVESSDMEDELLRLYKATDEASVLPSRAAKYFTVDKERKDLTGEEYVKYATKKGQLSYDLMTSLTKSSGYKALADTDKVEAVGMAYSYANAIAKTTVSKYKLDGWIEKANTTCKTTSMKPETYILLYMAQGDIESLKHTKGKDEGEPITNSKSLLVMQMIYNTPGLNTKQREALYEDFNVSEKVRKYSPALVDSKLEKMRKQ